MSLDRQRLEDFLEAIAAKYTGYELIELLEDNNILTVWDVIIALEDFIVEGKEHLEIDY